VQILALETTGLAGSVALLWDDSVRRQHRLLSDQRSAQHLAPAIAELIRVQNISTADVDLIAVATGPGSFTGLRVGVTTAKTLAFALSCLAIGIDTLDVIAAQAEGSEFRGQGSGNRRQEIEDREEGDGVELHAVMDAQRGELALARHGLTDDGRRWNRLGPNTLIAADEWLRSLAPQTRVTGPGLKRIADRLPDHIIVQHSSDWDPQAATVGTLAYAAWQSGRRDDLFRLAPQYIRPSYAEERTGRVVSGEWRQGGS
jgi:tRNA threonylcarbamoyl adenosine modification protein YeaZ